MRLLRLRVADGFDKQHRERTPEEVAEEYLMELVHRSLVLVLEVDKLGKAKSFRVHNVLRDLILSKMKELSFCQVLNRKNSYMDNQSCRLSIHYSRTNVDGNRAGLMNEPKNLMLLRCPENAAFEREDGLALSSALQEMKDLESLSMGSNRGKRSDLQTIKSFLPLLEFLSLGGPLEWSKETGDYPALFIDTTLVEPPPSTRKSDIVD
ncbi:hypothetical protein Cgig2_008700 [Carnegiea gigantea]|uniref:Disease resistance protein winged helix domain-containing protein n=1 Tax=Carnegiea gigantea TaxID=171969 RepID=A0A9Q1JFX4_9CARY|nr:hypothetical protein Cgig2_008700 [Carnegiea gigantea]